MRAMFMVVASIILAVGLFGCNRQQQVAEQAPVAVVPPPAAAVPPPPPPPAPVVEATRHVRHHHYRARQTSYESYSEDESASFEGESESSSVSYEQSGDRSEAGAAEAHGEVWVDGYGREHYGVTTPDDNPGAIDAHDQRLRHKVWRGWNSDCDRR